MVLLVLVTVAALMVPPSFASPVHDQATAASDHGEGYHGRVQIKVYRGPSKGYGYDKFAPWGYWVKQPEDDHAKHHHDH
ncbi:hypothetical protein Pcinc_020614 [Petrolisthes cinctipes]|uniref:Uncharacterized protein n=1 Tax=Petrolisthes cinctipes TaxID=88211 RepID=A0AAE1KL66_PETCI|nr:hypothetical protein Pcinc_020614 [Petrolisthes cinctipes]